MSVCVSLEIDVPCDFGHFPEGEISDGVEWCPLLSLEFKVICGWVLDPVFLSDGHLPGQVDFDMTAQDNSWSIPGLCPFFPKKRSRG